MKRLLVIVAIVPTLLAACTSPADTEGMTVTLMAAREPLDHTLKGAICVNNVTGGKETNPLWMIEIDNASFWAALERSLSNHGLLGGSQTNCAYGLNANILGYGQQMAGFNFTATTNVNYMLMYNNSDDPYLLKTVSNSFTATVGDAFVGVVRQRKAIEGAARENIREFIDVLMVSQP